MLEKTCKWRHGKEGVNGSSPLEGFVNLACKGWSCAIANHVCAPCPFFAACRAGRRGVAPLTTVATLASGEVPGERPAHERVRVTVTHPVPGLQVADDLHVLLQTAFSYDPLPVRDRAPVLLLDRREI